jgi:hypothetical protein
MSAPRCGRVAGATMAAVRSRSTPPAGVNVPGGGSRSSRSARGPPSTASAHCTPPAPPATTSPRSISACPTAAHPGRAPRVHEHETRPRRPTDVIAAGIRRVRPEVAGVRAALWARSDRQAALIVVTAAQQRLTTAQAVERAREASAAPSAAVPRHDPARCHRRRPGAGELDFADMCREWALPAPTRQVVRRGARARVYLDAYWDQYRLVVETEGIHHGVASTQIADALRQNLLSLRRMTPFCAFRCCVCVSPRTGSWARWPRRWLGAGAA